VSSSIECFRTILCVKMECRRNAIILAGAIAGHNVIRSIIEKLKQQSSDDDDDDDDEYDRWNQEANIFEGRIRFGRNLKCVTRIKGYVTTTIRDYSGRQFRKHFRMTRETFENVERMLTPYLIRTAESGRSTLDVRTQLLAVLWLLATPDSFR